MGGSVTKKSGEVSEFINHNGKFEMGKMPKLPPRPEPRH